MKSLKVLTCTPVAFKGDHTFFARESGLLSRGLRMAGVESFCCYAYARTRRRHGSIPIKFRERYGGEPSVGLGKFGEKARELLNQLKRI